MLVPTLWETIAGGSTRAQVCVISILDLQVPYPKEVNYLLSDFVYYLLRSDLMWTLIYKGYEKPRITSEKIVFVYFGIRHQDFLHGKYSG